MKELMQYGAILVGPRTKKGKARKQHVCCPSCYKKIKSQRGFFRSIIGAEIRGPILLGPPGKSGKGMVDRYDISVAFYEKLQRRFFQRPKKKRKRQQPHSLYHA